MPPRTAVPWSVSLAGLFGFGIGLTLALLLQGWPAVALAALVLCTGAPMWSLERQRQISRTFGHEDVTAPQAASSNQRRKWRTYGVTVVAALWATTLNVLPLARTSVLNGFWQALGTLWPLVVIGLALYTLRASTAHIDGIERIGRWLAKKSAAEPFPWAVLRDQLVKAFFLPLMISFAYEWAAQADPFEPTHEPHWYFLLFALLYLIDTVFATVGYLSTSRKLDAHIRSSNPYWLGWASALICYPPFFTWLQQAGVNYRDGIIWANWLQASQPLFYLWGTIILILSSIYALSTVVFGIRFSNLTHRGIITHGPYRFTKHPAYISKNVSWWMISIPFISSTGTGTALLHCLILAVINFIYWVRARTEERHLMHDPVYRAYADWIAHHGLFAFLNRNRS